MRGIRIAYIQGANNTMDFTDDFYDDLISRFGNAEITLSLDINCVEIVRDVWFKPYIDNLYDVCNKHGMIFYIESESTKVRVVIHPVVYERNSYV